MGFMDEVSKYNTQVNMCKVGIFLEHQDKDELKAAGFSTVITDKDIRDAHARHTLKAVTRALKDRGFTGSDEGLAKHIKNQCTCVKVKVAVNG